MNLPDKNEVFPLVDEKGNVIGKALRSECHSDNSLLHPVVHVHIFNKKGELFLQKRPLFKDCQPGKWDTAVGGHIDYGESFQTALFREIEEELGITIISPKLIKEYIWRTERESEYVYVNIALYNDTITINKDELDDGRFWNFDEIRSCLGKDIFTPNFENEFKWLENLNIP
jgi:isopentenyldiphosphate isomerase